VALHPERSSQRRLAIRCAQTSKNSHNRTVLRVITATTSSHLHVVRVDTLDRLYRPRQVELGREVVYHLQAGQKSQTSWYDRLTLLCSPFIPDIPRDS
jgi:hypothetical protein